MSPTPRDLDPKFKSETVTPEDIETNTSEKEEVPMIVYRQQVTNPDGTAGEKVHGPMPVADWPAYEKENNL